MASGVKVAAMTEQKPTKMVRPKHWDETVEEAYRLQTAGYRDAVEYETLKGDFEVDRWPHNGYIKKLRRKDGNYNYFNKERECPDKEIHKTKIYTY